MFRRIVITIFLLLVTMAFAIADAADGADVTVVTDAASAAYRAPTTSDSIYLWLNKRIREAEQRGIGKLDMRVYVKGESRATRRRRLCRIIPNLLPFEAGTGTAYFEALCQVNYQSPCNLQISPIAFRSSNRKGRKLLNEIYPMLLPFYTLSQNEDDRYYIFPFTDDGLEEYQYAVIDTLAADGTTCYRIAFTPRTQHHFLLTGDITIAPATARAISLSCSGRIDFGTFRMEMGFASFDGVNAPVRSVIDVEYNYAGNKGINHYECAYTYDQFVDLASIDRHAQSLDLTSVYRADPLQTIDWDTIRPAPLAAEAAKALDNPDSRTTKRRSLYQDLPERLMSSSNIDAFGTDLKISGPLDPASIGYDKFNGISIRERIRWSYLFDNGQSIIIRPQVGYNFGIKEFRYRVTAEWVYWPERRCGLQFYAANRSSGFSSQFINVVNNALDSTGVDFNALGIDYYHHYETRVEQSFELATGLMAYAGLLYNYRNPVKHGERAIPQARLAGLVANHYADFNPYLRLEWTPRQYYHYRGRHKLYIASYFPTVSFEVAKAVSGVWDSQGDYLRSELNVEQAIRISRNRRLYYRVGAGAFYNQKGEYFVNYRYFSRSQYPESWSDNIGGVFHLLDDYWYSSSPGYFQSHVMYESPFLLLHQMKKISQYAIKERIYLSTLYADGKQAYTETGYGMGNNYFNIGVFIGFKDLKYMDAGIKATLEIDQHW